MARSFVNNIQLRGRTLPALANNLFIIKAREHRETSPKSPCTLTNCCKFDWQHLCDGFPSHNSSLATQIELRHCRGESCLAKTFQSPSRSDSEADCVAKHPFAALRLNYEIATLVNMVCTYLVDLAGK